MAKKKKVAKRVEKYEKLFNVSTYSDNNLKNILKKFME